MRSVFRWFAVARALILESLLEGQRYAPGFFEKRPVPPT